MLRSRQNHNKPSPHHRVVLHSDRSSNDLGNNPNTITVEPPQPRDAGTLNYFKEGEIESTSDQTITNRETWLETWQRSLLYIFVCYSGVDPAQNLVKHKRCLCVLRQLSNRSIGIM